LGFFNIKGKRLNGGFDKRQINKRENVAVSFNQKGFS
jgi:hypothetical protein